MELCQRKGYVLVGILKIRVGGQTHISDFVMDVYYRLPLNQLDKVSKLTPKLFKPCFSLRTIATNIY